MIWCSNFNTDAQDSITWHEPPPVTTVSDSQEVHTSKIQFYEGSINEQLNWRFSATQTVQFVTLVLDDTNAVVNILPSTGEVTVSKDFTSRVNVTWVTGHITIVIYKVTTSDKGVFSCQLSVPGNVWRSNIEVVVLGKVIIIIIIHKLMQQDGKEKEMANLSPKLHCPLNRSFFCKRQENINLVKIMTKRARPAVTVVAHKHFAVLFFIIH